MSEDVLERAKIIAEKMGDRRIYYAGCWTLAEDLGYSKTGENTEFKEVAHPEDFIWCEVLPGINLLPELIAEVERLRSPEISGDLKKKIRMIRHCLHNPHSKQQAIDAFNAAGELARLLAAKDARIRELEAAREDVGDCQSIAYMLGGKKKAEENKILIDYIKRLEAAFREAKRCPTCNGAGKLIDVVISRNLGRVESERVCPLCEGKWEEKAREALEEIKTGGAMSNSVDICPFDDDLTCPLDYHTCEIYRERMEEEQ